MRCIIIHWLIIVIISATSIVNTIVSGRSNVSKSLGERAILFESLVQKQHPFKNNIDAGSVGWC